MDGGGAPSLYALATHCETTLLPSFSLRCFRCCWYAPGAIFARTAWERERVHNPFPQLKRVAVLPFFNQSSEPTVDTELVAENYYAALQAIPGFEVLPVGVTKAQWLHYAQAHGEPRTGEEFQELARDMGVEA